MDGELARISKLVNTENWGVWKFQIRIILNSQNAWGVASGTVLKPEAPAVNVNDQTRQAYEKELAAWFKADAVAQKVIATTIGDQPMLHIINCTTAREMWQKLSDVYEQKSEAGIHLLQQKWYSATKEDADSIATHIAKLENLAHRLRLMGEQIPDSMIITKILMTLPSSYRYFVSSWESAPAAERTLTNLTSRLSIEESRNSAQEKSEAEALASKVQRHKPQQRKNMRGPPRPGKCYECHEPGHWARNCPKRKSGSNNGGDKKTWSNSGGNKKPQGEGLVSEALTSVGSEETGSQEWILDTGASDHMCNVKQWFTTYEEFDEPRSVRVGDGGRIDAYGKGCVNAQMFNGTKWNRNHLEDVLYVPELKYNLFSVGAALDKGLQMLSTRSNCRLVKGERTVAVGVRRNKLYIMQFKVAETESTSHASVAERETLRNWHEKLAHQNYRHVKKVLNQFQIKTKDKEEPFCDACAKGKIHRLPFPKSTTRTESIGEIIHADLCGPMQVNSIGGSRYFLLLKDDFSHFRTVYFMKNKAETELCIDDFLRKAEKHCAGGVKVLRTDNGLEFINKTVKKLTHEYGIRHQRTVAYTPEQNGTAERENRTVVEAARTMLQARGYDSEFWAEAVNTAVHVLNSSGTSSIKDVTPFELWFQRKPDIENLRIFGEEVYTHIPREKRQKWDAKGKRGFFVGYNDKVKGYKVWYPDDGIITTVRDVRFTGRVEEMPRKDRYEDNGKEWCIIENSKMEEADGPDHRTENAPEEPLANEQHIEEPEDNNEEDIYEEAIPQQIQAPEQGRVLRDRELLRRPSRYDDYVDDDVFVAECQEPLSYKEAIESKEAAEWKKAMDEEMEALSKNQVWELVNAPKNQEVVDNKWTFKLKRDADGNLLRHKARLVARGFSQRKGIDYTETFSPVVRFDSIRAMLAVAADEGMHLQQFDVKTAFLYGDIEENIFMKQPQGYDDETGRVCKLKRSLYGLKQSSRCWNQRFTKFLEKFNLEATEADSCMFTNQQKDYRLILAIYIDDGLVACKDKKLIDKLLAGLRKEFEITSSEANIFLGLQIERGENGSIFVHQRTYARKILDRFRMEDANPVTIPADPHQELSPSAHSTKEEETTTAPYREAIGSLMYLCVATRPDITFAVNLTSRHLEKPTKIHWNAVKRILKYLKGTVGYGIKFKRNQERRLLAYSDSDYAGELETRRSTTGYAVKFGTGIISWSSQRQQAVALSTTEAEYMAASQTVKEIAWLKTLFKRLLGTDDVPTTLFLDNQSAIQLIKNPVHHKRTKHIDVKYHYIRSQYKDKVFSLEYVPSKDQQADILTKALPRISYQHQRENLGVLDNTAAPDTREKQPKGTPKSRQSGSVKDSCHRLFRND